MHEIVNLFCFFKMIYAVTTFTFISYRVIVCPISKLRLCLYFLKGGFISVRNFQANSSEQSQILHNGGSTASLSRCSLLCLFKIHNPNQFKVVINQSHFPLSFDQLIGEQWFDVEQCLNTMNDYWIEFVCCKKIFQQHKQMEDCLFEIKGNSQHTIQKQSGADVVDDQEIVIEDNDGELMPEFKVKVDEVQRILERIKVNNEKIDELKKSYTSATTSMTEKDVSAKLDKLMQENTRSQDRLKGLMKEVATDVEEARQKEPDEPETRMKIDIQAAVTLKVQAVLQDSQKAQMDFKNGLRNKISRQAGCLDSNLTDQQIEEICEDPNKMQELLQKKIYGQASIQLQNAVQDIQDKYQDILKLERSVQQVYQLFSDMAVLVQNQGELIDNIEQNMIKAKDYVQRGEKHLVQAKKDHQAARKKMCCIIMIGLVLILVIVGPILGTSL